jgi:hypothetical protein
MFERAYGNNLSRIAYENGLKLIENSLTSFVIEITYA